ncbi:MAG: peptidylprolyl isomerase [Spirochaetales bacterium]|nr:peptidylprolyl isomerase [Spirochaetales bacterium]
MVLKRIISLVILLVVAASCVFAQEQEIKPVAEVNGVKITSIDLERQLNMMYQQAISQGQQINDSNINQLRQSALQVLISRELLFQSATEKKYEADPAAADDYINSLTINYGGTEKLQEALDAQGISIDELKDSVSRYNVINKLIDEELRPQVVIEDADLEKYYTDNKQYFHSEETVRASHILVKAPTGSSEEDLKAAYDKISKIRKEVIDGKDFAEAAKEYSDCPSAPDGGDLGEFGHGMMVPEFDKAAFALEPGKVSEPVQTQYGYHLILVTDKKDESEMPFEQVKEDIKNYLADIKLDEIVKNYVADLMTTATVNIF